MGVRRAARRSQSGMVKRLLLRHEMRADYRQLRQPVQVPG
jgi:hypothetical protein